MRICTVTDCGRKYLARGLCKKHYHALVRYKDPLGGRTYVKRGEGTISRGYRLMGRNGEQVFEHVLVAEKALGRKLKNREIVHHVNCKRDDNRPENLVICPNDAYHATIHRRMRALDACGNANWRKCSICHQHEDPERLYIHGSHAYHAKCHADAERRRKLSNETINQQEMTQPC